MIYTEQILQNLPCYAINRSGIRHRRNFGKDIEDFRCTSLTSRTPLRNLKTFIAFDTETTGLNLSDDIIEVSAVRFDGFIPKLVFSTLVKPRKSIPAQASAVNHITNAMVVNAPIFYELIPSFEFVFRDYPLVAHNAPFDVKMMYVNGFDAMKDKKVYDTCGIGKRLYPTMQNHKLATLCNAHGIINGNAHRAASDALSCGLLFVQFLMVRFNCNNTDELCAKAQQ